MLFVMKGRVVCEIIEYEGVDSNVEKMKELSELLFAEENEGYDAGIAFFSEIFQLNGVSTYKIVPSLMPLLFSAFANPEVTLYSY